MEAWKLTTHENTAKKLNKVLWNINSLTNVEKYHALWKTPRSYILKRYPKEKNLIKIIDIL